MYWVMSHQSDWGYYTALESDPPMKWPVQTVLWFLKVNQGDIGLGHLENIASWKHLDNFSTLSGRNQFFTLCTFFLNCLFFPARVKLVPYMRRSFGKTTCDDAVWSWDSSMLRILFTSFVLQVSVMRTKWLWSLSELIINREWMRGLYFLKLVSSHYNKRKLLSRTNLHAWTNLHKRKRILIIFCVLSFLTWRDATGSNWKYL